MTNTNQTLADIYRTQVADLTLEDLQGEHRTLTSLIAEENMSDTPRRGHILAYMEARSVVTTEINSRQA